MIANQSFTRCLECGEVNGSAHLVTGCWEYEDCACDRDRKARRARVRETWFTLIDLLFVLARASEAQAAREAERADVVAFVDVGLARVETACGAPVAHALEGLAREVEMGTHIGAASGGAGGAVGG